MHSRYHNTGGIWHNSKSDPSDINPCCEFTTGTVGTWITPRKAEAIFYSS